ncbi:MAG: NAD(P)-dependent oxidoreductase [Desulfobulbaceae bacterium]|nr:NAD(P)-dependent oxidoreductase [Desulfobulbaceae bacterium]
MTRAKAKIVVVGAAGFIGSRLLSALAARPGQRLRVLVHRHGLASLPGSEIETVTGDLLRPATLAGLIEPGCLVLNLSYLAAHSRAENLLAMENLVNACRRGGAHRLIHCSTAVVAGPTGPGLVDEKTPCRPLSKYGRTKLAIEELLLARASENFSVTILRPTAVFGPGGRNLLKLAEGLCQGNALGNYLKACLYNRRRMNLVCLDNVVAALIFLADSGPETAGQVFIIADDDSPLNNYRDLAAILREEMVLAPARLPLIPVPAFILRRLLKLAGRPTADPEVSYSSAKISALGFQKPCTLAAGISQFADWYRREYPGAKSGRAR